MDFLALVNKVLIRIDESQIDATELATPTSNEVRRVKEDVNSAYRHICTLLTNPRFLMHVGSFNTIAGQASYAADGSANGFASNIDLGRINVIRSSGSDNIRIVSHNEFLFRTADYNVINNGYPQLAYISSNAVVFYPAPAGVLGMEYSAVLKVSDLSAATDEPLIPLAHRDCIFWYALFLAKQQDNEASIEFQMFERHLNVLRTENRSNENMAIRSEYEVANANFVSNDYLFGG